MMILSVRPRAFTLLEMLVAAAIFTVLAAALYQVLGSALRLRERAYASVEQALPAAAALDVVRRDLAGAVIPSGTLAGAWTGTSEGSGDSANDTLEFYTASGRLSDETTEPWGEIQQVKYLLEDSETQTSQGGRDLVREVTRNLLSPTEVDPESQRLLGGVASLHIQYLDDETWSDSWDSTANDNRAPEAVKMEIEFTAPGADEPARAPLTLVCQIASSETSDTTQTNTSTSDDSSSSNGSDSGS